MRFRLTPLALLPLALALLPVTARAEPTSWFAVGGGYALQHNVVTKANDNAFALDGAIGVGTPATSPIVVGGVFRGVGYVGFGVDMSLALRLATQGYCVGDFGAALDLGVIARLWGDGDYGNYPLYAALTLGAPYGFQLAVGANGNDLSRQSPMAWGGFAALEFDFLRLTTMRSGATTKTWPNPAPANAPPAPDQVAP